MWRLIYGVPSWLLFEILHIPLILIGWVLIPIAAVCKAWRRAESERDGRQISVWSWPFMWLWSNDEDGVIAGEQYKDFKNDILQAIYWTALRNPVNNLRFVKYVSVKIDPTIVGFRGTFGKNDIEIGWAVPPDFKEQVMKYDTKVPHWFFAWQGFYTNWYWQFMFRGKLKRFWIGWKIYPTDIFGLAPTSYRKNGAGFAVQFKTILDQRAVIDAATGEVKMVK